MTWNLPKIREACRSFIHHDRYRDDWDPTKSLDDALPLFAMDDCFIKLRPTDNVERWQARCGCEYHYQYADAAALAVCLARLKCVLVSLDAFVLPEQRVEPIVTCAKCGRMDCGEFGGCA